MKAASSMPIGMCFLLLIEEVGRQMAGRLAAEATSAFFAEMKN